MAIKNRRGEYANFDPYKMLQGEWGITTSGDPNSADGKSVYMCFAAGNVKRMATYDDMVENIDRATEKVQERLTQEVREATAEANSTIQKATQATQSANTAADRANEAAEAAESYVLGDISEKTVTFEMALQRANIQSNDSLAVAFGKLAKFYADLDDHAFSAPVPNLLSDDSTKSLAANMGKALKTDIGDLTQLPTTAKGSLVEAITEQNSALVNNTMMFRKTLTSSDQIDELEIGIYDVQRSIPPWLGFGWSRIFIPGNGSLNGAFAISYAGGDSAKFRVYGQREGAWIDLI